MSIKHIECAIKCALQVSLLSTDLYRAIQSVHSEGNRTTTLTVISLETSFILLISL